MEEIKSGVKKRFTRIFDLPEEILLNLPLIMLVGMEQLVIENHHGIKEYESNLIAVNSALGIWNIEGEDMEIESIDKQTIKIKGKIFNLYLKVEGEK